MHADCLRFSATARAVAIEARRMGLLVPAFRSPPGLSGATRTVRRSGDGVTVAVVVRGRALADVSADVVEGVVVANRLVGAAAVRCRRRLTVALDAAQCEAA